MITGGVQRQRPVPREVVKTATRYGGLTLDGQPKFRVVWGGARLDPLGFRKYAYNPVLLERWIIEVWKAPEAYGSREAWESNEQDLGPFPSRGDYELLASLNSSDNVYVEISPEIVTFAIDAYRRSEAMSHWDRRDLHISAVRQRERDWDTFADAVIDGNAPAFNSQPTVFLN